MVSFVSAFCCPLFLTSALCFCHLVPFVSVFLCYGFLPPPPPPPPPPHLPSVLHHFPLPFFCCLLFWTSVILCFCLLSLCLLFFVSAFCVALFLPSDVLCFCISFFGGVGGGGGRSCFCFLLSLFFYLLLFFCFCLILSFVSTLCCSLFLPKLPFVSALCCPLSFSLLLSFVLTICCPLFLPSATTRFCLLWSLKWPGCNRVQITCNTSSAYHVQHVVCHVI